MIRPFLLSVAVLLVSAGGSAAQSASPAVGRHPEEGRPFIRTYAPLDVNAAGQNWAIVQDARGVLYFGSQSGVTEFDGVSWRLIETPDLSTVRSLAIDESGVIYVGSVLDFGYLAPDPAGSLQYVSLRDKVPADARGFTDIWRTFATRDGVLFQTEQAIYRWANGAITVIRPPSRLNRASLLDGQLYVTLPETGLNVLEGDTFRSLPGTSALSSEVYPVILRYDETRLLIGTRFDGLFLYDGATMTRLATGLDQYLKSSSLYKGIELPDGTFAFATTNAGMGLMDRQGQAIMTLGRTQGLPSDAVYHLFVDREGAIWTAGERGMGRVEFPSPATVFSEADGYTGAWVSTRFQGRLYLAWQSGVKRLVPAEGTRPAHFVPVPGIGQQAWGFAEMTDPAGARPATLVVASTDGVYEIRGDTAITIHAPRDGTFRAATLERSRVDPTRVWVGLFDGLASFRWLDGRWIDEGRVPGVTDPVRSLAEDDDGSLWAGSAADGLLRLTFANRPESGVPRPEATVTRHGARDGLTEGPVYAIRIGRTIYFTPWASSADNVVATWDEATKRFEKDEVISSLPHDRLRNSFGVVAGPKGTLLANAGKGTRMLAPDGKGGWTVDDTYFSRFGPIPSGFVFVEPDDVAWFAWKQEFVRFDTTRAASAKPSFRVLVRRVAAGPDRVLFGGIPSGSPPRLPASTDSLRFEFSAPTFIDETATQYQTRLDGLDADWTAWSSEARRDFTNLGFGDYRFRVRARNVTGALGEEAEYAFAILPPWYRTWWAYAGYLLLAGLLVFAVDRIQRRRLLGKERERARFAEARLRAEAAEQLARSEREGKKNIELLSDIGREITSSLDFETIFGRLYERVNQLADAGVFGIGLYRAERQEIEYKLAIEEGKRYAPYTRSTTDPDQLPVWCIEHREPVFINDLQAECGKYVRRYDEQTRRLEDGTMSRTPQSIIYLPLLAKDRVLGVFTIQSFEKHAYTEHHLNMMRSLASYTAIALDNAAAYRQLNEQEHEIRRLFEEAERARATAEEADAAKSAFLSTVSHELRTPLTSVLGFAKIIKKRLDDRIFPLVPTGDRKVAQTITQVEDNLKVVVSEGERLTKLIDDVLDLAKIESGKLEWHIEEVGVADVVERATAATSSLFEQKGLQLVKDVQADLPVLKGDRDRLIQVVINLISNAVKFTSAGSVTCRAVRRDGEVVVSVIDTGPGIAPVDQPKVFERFKQVGDTLTDKPKGTGLGLPICREIVEHHGGRIWVRSTPGQGSTFSFSLPVPGAAPAVLDGSAPVELAALIRQLRDQVVVTTPRTAGREPRILVVDDEANIRELLTQEFTDAGYIVHTASNGREAVEKVRADRPDLVVLDVMMPEMNGFDVAAVLKNDPATMDIPIVILSIVQDRERGFRLGVDRYLTKPIDTDLLFREVGALIEQKTSHKRVLVVDEDASTVKTLTDVLTARGYSVVEARGEDLVARAVAVRPDIILLNSVASARSPAARMLRFEKGLENVLFLVYQ
ncbi:MAG TPA: ATP-binding protein [Vicinamibacterales bacterium]|nr:ATP-binding protein [Vicinamibacterales bacterium]